MLALCTRIQTLLRGHIWGLFLCKDSDFAELEELKLYGKDLKLLTLLNWKG